MRYAVLSLLVFAVACGDDDKPEVDSTSTESETTEAACTVQIEASADAQTIQQALIDAQAGAVICFASGTYAIGQELSLRVSGVTLRGPSDHTAVLDFATQTTGAQGLSVDADDFVMQGLAVKNTRGDGVRVDASTGVTFKNVLVSWDSPTGDAFYSGLENGAYALYPVGCTNVLVEDSEVVGSSDAGIYVGQSQNIIVRDNYVHGCVAGIEIENCIGAEVYGNEATDNTGGLLVFDLPGLDLVNGHTTRLHNNTVYDNNRVNFAPDGVVQMVPAGTGIMVLSAKDVEIDNNSIAENGTTGVLVVSLQSLAAFDPDAPTAPEGFDAWTHDLYIHDNLMTANGAQPGGVFADPPAGAGLAAVVHAKNGNSALDAVLWDGFGADGTTDNASQGDERICVRANTSSTTRNLNIAELAVWIAAGDETAALPDMPQNQADIDCQLDIHTAITL